MKQQLILQQRPHLTPDEYRAFRRIYCINRATLEKVTLNDFSSEFYDISKDTIYPAITNIEYLKQIFFNLKNKGYIIPTLVRTRPQGYFAKEFDHLLTNDMTYIPFPAQVTNYSSNSYRYQEPRDIGELLNFGIHDILFCSRVKGSHQQFIKHGLKENAKKNINVGTFHINNLKFIVRSSNQDTIMIHVATSKNQIMLNIPNHIENFDSALDQLIIKLSNTYGINISHHDSWIIKLMHVAADYNEASGDKFHLTWKDAKGIFNRKYSKLIPSQNTNTRIETQIIPNLTKKLAIQTKLGSNIQQHPTFNSILSVSNNAAGS